jgi:hypothetical protein
MNTEILSKFVKFRYFHLKKLPRPRRRHAAMDISDRYRKTNFTIRMPKLNKWNYHFEKLREMRKERTENLGQVIQESMS